MQERSKKDFIFSISFPTINKLIPTIISMEEEEVEKKFLSIFNISFPNQ